MQKETKVVKQKNRSFLAVALAIVTVLLSLGGSVLISDSVNASEVQEVVTTEVEYRIQEVLATPPIQEVMANGSIDTEALTDEITAAVTADVLSKASRQWASLSTEDMDTLETALRESIVKSLTEATAQIDPSSIVNQVNENLNVSMDESFLEEEWLVTLVTEIVTTTVEQTLVDVLTEEMKIVNNDLNLIQSYVDENLDAIYDLIIENQVDISMLTTEIANIELSLQECATKEELLQLTNDLEAKYIELSAAQSDLFVQISVLDSTMAQRYDELAELIANNAVAIDELNSRLSKAVTDMTVEINTLSNQIKEEMSSSNEELTTNFTTEITELTTTVNEYNTSLTENMETNYNELLNELTVSNTTNAEALELTKNTINNTIENYRSKTESNIQYVDNKLTESIWIYDNIINGTIDEVAQNIYNDLNQFDNEIINLTNSFNDNSKVNFNTLHQYAKTIEQSLQYNVSNIQDVTNNNTQLMQQWVSDIDSLQQSNVTMVANQLNTNINYTADYVKNNVNTAIASLNTNIKSGISTAFSSFASNTATAINNLGTSTEDVFESMGEVVKVKSWNPTTGVLELTSTAYPFDGATTISQTTVTAPTLSITDVTLGEFSSLPGVSIVGGEVFIDGEKATTNTVVQPDMSTINYQDKVTDPGTESYVDTEKSASNLTYDDTVTNPEDRTYNTVVIDEQGVITDEVATFSDTP